MFIVWIIPFVLDLLPLPPDGRNPSVLSLLFFIEVDRSPLTLTQTNTHTHTQTIFFHMTLSTVEGTLRGKNSAASLNINTQGCVLPTYTKSTSIHSSIDFRRMYT